MNGKVENSVSKFDLLKWGLAIALLIGGVVANSYFATQPVALRAIGWLALLAVAILFAYQTAQGQKLWNFFQESRIELRKVVWPTRQETIQTTLVVVAMVVATALILWLIDSLLLWLVNFITG